MADSGMARALQLRSGMKGLEGGGRVSIRVGVESLGVICVKGLRRWCRFGAHRSTAAAALSNLCG